MFNPDLPYVSYAQEHGGLLHRNIKASYPKNAHKVVAELNALFHEQSEEALSKGSRYLSFLLDRSCDSITSSTFLPTKEEVFHVVKEILLVADKLNHHPAITVSGGNGTLWLFYVTCMTHSPPGLSVKDPRLARKIREILSDLHTMMREIPDSHTEFLRGHAASLFNAENLTGTTCDKKSEVIKALTDELVGIFKGMTPLHPLFRDQAIASSVSLSTGDAINDPAKLADFAAGVSAINVEELDSVLQTTNVEEKLQKALVLLKKALSAAEIQTRSKVIQTVWEGRRNIDLISESQILHTKLWHWQKNIGRTQPELDVAEEDATELEGETSSVPGLNFWRLNNADDLRIFSEQNEAPPSHVPTMRRLIP